MVNTNYFKMETYILDVMEGKRRGKGLLRALSYLYQGGVALRNAAYDRGWIKAVDCGLPVISVGNIVAGGTGKTPFVKFLAEHLMNDFQVAILSRGYRSSNENTGRSLLVTTETPVLECGDEPYWLAKHLPRAQVWVGKNRAQSAKRAREAGAELLILDDGMQHRQLKRDFEIVLVNGDDPFGKGFFLPRGLLRDAPHRLKDAHLIVVRGQTDEQLSQWTKAPLVFTQTKTKTSLQGKKVAAFCAIANPHRFLKSVREAGGEIVATLLKPDHDVFSVQELEEFAERSQADIVVCTEKDEVKLPVSELPVVALRSDLEITSHFGAWEEMLNTIKTRVKNDTRISNHTS